MAAERSTRSAATTLRGRTADGVRITAPRSTGRGARVEVPGSVVIATVPAWCAHRR